jgi:hypothetical protein
MPLLFSIVYSLTHNCSLFFFYLEFTWGGAPTPLSSGACHTLATVTSFLLSKVAGKAPPLLPSPAGLFIYSSSGECSFPTLQSPICYVSFFFFPAACLLFSFSFSLSLFPGWGSVCPEGYADLFQGCLWECCMPLSLPGGLLLPSRIGVGIWW